MSERLPLSPAALCSFEKFQLVPSQGGEVPPADNQPPACDLVPEREAAPVLDHDGTVLQAVAQGVEQSLPLTERLRLYEQYGEDWLAADELTYAQRVFQHVAAASQVKISAQERAGNSLRTLLAAAYVLEKSLPLPERLELYDRYPDWLDVPEVVYLQRFPMRALVLIAKHVPPTFTDPTSELAGSSEAAEDFERWLQSETGRRIRRSLERQAAGSGGSSPLCDGDDMVQRGLIYLWDKWQTDPAWLVQSHPAYISRAAYLRGKNDRFNHRYWRGNHINEGLPLLEKDSGEEAEALPAEPRVPTNGHLPPQDRLTLGSDRRIDIAYAIEATIQELTAAEEGRPSNGQQVPVERIVRTICQAFMYHAGQTMSNGQHPCRTSSDGGMRAYWSQFITERQWYRWKPRVLDTLRKHLETYGEVEANAPHPKAQKVTVQVFPEPLPEARPYQVRQTPPGAALRLYPAGQKTRLNIGVSGGVRLRGGLPVGSRSCPPSDP